MTVARQKACSTSISMPVRAAAAENPHSVSVPGVTVLTRVRPHHLSPDLQVAGLHKLEDQIELLLNAQRSLQPFEADRKPIGIQPKPASCREVRKSKRLRDYGPAADRQSYDRGRLGIFAHSADKAILAPLVLDVEEYISGLCRIRDSLGPDMEDLDSPNLSSMLASSDRDGDRGSYQGKHKDHPAHTEHIQHHFSPS